MIQRSRLLRAVLASVLATAVLARVHAGVAIGYTVGQAIQAFDDNSRNYNLITLGGGATFTNFGDTQGSLAINGDLNVNSSGAFATQISASSDPTLYVTGAANFTGNAMLNAGYATLVAQANNANFTWSTAGKSLTSTYNASNSLNWTNAGSSGHDNDNPTSNPIPTNWNWATVNSAVVNASNALAAATVNGTISVSGQNLIFSPNVTPVADSTVVFTLDASKITGGNTYNGQLFSNIQINVPTDVNYVINVVNASGTTLFGSGVNFNSGSNDNQLLWNFEGSGTVTLGGGSFYGSILAPTITIANGNATINGQVIAQAFQDIGSELHFQGFTAFVVVVPEPLTFALWGLGLCAVAIVARQKLVG